MLPSLSFDTIDSGRWIVEGAFVSDLGHRITFWKFWAGLPQPETTPAENGIVILGWRRVDLL